jgi:hypothetical protein
MVALIALMSLVTAAAVMGPTCIAASEATFDQSLTCSLSPFSCCSWLLVRQALPSKSAYAQPVFRASENSLVGVVLSLWPPVVSTDNAHCGLLPPALVMPLKSGARPSAARKGRR